MIQSFAWYVKWDASYIPVPPASLYNNSNYFMYVIFSVLPLTDVLKWWGNGTFPFNFKYFRVIMRPTLRIAFTIRFLRFQDTFFDYMQYPYILKARCFLFVNVVTYIKNNTSNLFISLSFSTKSRKLSFIFWICTDTRL